MQQWHAIIILCGVVSLYGTILLTERRWRGAKGRLLPSAKGYAGSLTVAIYEYLCLEEAPEAEVLLSQIPTMRERVALAEVVATLSRGIVECYPERIRTLSEAWGLEEALTHRALHRRGRVGLRALHDLLALRPSEECVGRIARKYYPSPSHSFAQLLLVAYSSPRRVASLLARHPHTLSWQEVGEVVGVLKMHSPVLCSVERNIEDEGINVDMFVLYLAAVEGIGDPSEVARGLSGSPNQALRTAAFNVLFGEQLFGATPQGDIGS